MAKGTPIRETLKQAHMATKKGRFPSSYVEQFNSEEPEPLPFELVSALINCTRDLVRLNLQSCEATYTMTTTEALEYELAPGFAKLVQLAIWNGTERIPISLVSAEDALALEVNKINFSLLLARITGDELKFTDTTSYRDYKITYTYIDNRVFRDAEGNKLRNPNSDDDYCVFKDDLLYHGIMVHFNMAKGTFDPTSQIAQHYAELINLERAQDSGNPIINLAGSDYSIDIGGASLRPQSRNGEGYRPGF